MGRMHQSQLTQADPKGVGVVFTNAESSVQAHTILPIALSTRVFSVKMCVNTESVVDRMATVN